VKNPRAARILYLKLEEEEEKKKRNKGNRDSMRRKTRNGLGAGAGKKVGGGKERRRGEEALKLLIRYGTGNDNYKLIDRKSDHPRRAHYAPTPLSTPLHSTSSAAHASGLASREPRHL